jgi:ketosteroid isomerase-like protein
MSDCLQPFFKNNFTVLSFKAYTLTFKFYIMKSGRNTYRWQFLNLKLSNMKSFILILGALLFCAQTFSQTADEEAIKKVCIAETQAYVDFDYDALASYHVQSADDQLALNKADGSFSSISGWEAISKALKNYFQTSKKEPVKLASDNFTFVIHGDMAFACYNASSQNTEGKTSVSKEFRTLLKINGQWKILSVLVYGDHTSGK